MGAMAPDAESGADDFGVGSASLATRTPQGFPRRIGDYAIHEKIGGGAQGSVYSAFRIVPLNGVVHKVCIKVFEDVDCIVDEPELKQEIQDEAHIAAGLSHPNVVSVIEVAPDGHWIAMELVEGVNLRELLKSLPKHRLPPNLAVYVTAELCKAFVYLHELRRGNSAAIVHRDVSPANILISSAGAVKLADFGIATVVREIQTRTKTVRGKYSYMSPEQARKQNVDGRSDLYSLGIVLYEVLAGRRPVRGHDENANARVAAGDYPRLSKVDPTLPSGLVSIVEQLMARDPDRRFQSARALIRALSEVAKQEVPVDLDLGLELGELVSDARAQPPVDAEEVLRHVRDTVVDGGRDKPTVEVVRGYDRDLLSTVHSEAQPSSDAVETNVVLDNEGPLAADAVKRPRFRRALTAGLVVTCIAGLGVWRVVGNLQGEHRAPLSLAAFGTHEPAIATLADEHPARPAEVLLQPVSDQIDRSVSPLHLDESGATRALGNETSRAPALPKKSSSTAAEVTVGVRSVVPVKIWVDGKPRGEAVSGTPLVVAVAQGQHTIAAGTHREAQAQPVRVHAGEKKDVIFDSASSE